MNSPIQWFGGKGMMTKKLLPFIPPHVTYVEPFGGGASLLFAKEPSKVEVYNDLNSGLVTMFRVMRDPEQMKQLQFLAENTPVSREEFNWCKTNWQYIADPVKRAWAFYYMQRVGFAGYGASFGVSVSTSVGGMASTCSSYINSVENLPAISARLRRVQIEHKNGFDVIDQYDTKETVFYLDPPYTPDSRRSGKYAHEAGSKMHMVLVDKLLGLNGMAILSGYSSPIYERLVENGWERVEFDVVCIGTDNTKCATKKDKADRDESLKRVEAVWICPKTQKMLKIKEQLTKGTGAKRNGNLKKETIDKIKSGTKAKAKGRKGNS